MPRWGVSWGSRLFRVGQSPNGRWWGYFNFMGFRFFRYLDEGGNRRWSRSSKGSLSNGGQQSSPPTFQGQVPTFDLEPEIPVTSNQMNWNEVASQENSTQPVQKSNDAILRSIQKEIGEN